MKKRFISGILALSLMLALASCGLIPTPNPTEPTEPTEPSEPLVELEDQTISILENTSTAFRTLGRTYERNGGLACDYSCTGIEFKAFCEGDIYLHIEATKEAYLTVYIDGERSEDRVRVVPETPLVRVARGVEYGEHTIMIVNQSQFPLATMIMHSVMLTGELREKPADREMFIEFYGDSILHGSNVYKGGTSALSSDATCAFGWIAAQHLGADCSLIGRGGLGLVKSTLSYNMLDIYDLCGSISLKNVPKYDFARQPDAVVIRLGSNDYLNGGLSSTPEVYAAGVEEFIGILREKYGADVPLVWVYGHRNDGTDFWEATKEALDGLKAAGDDNIHYCKVSEAYCPKSEGGDGLHPDKKRAEKMGQEVADFLEDLLK